VSTSLELRSASPEATRALAAAFADVLEPGDVVALSGELGAGKTCFVQGVAQGLGIEARVTSPTFVLVKHYTGRLPLVHCDVYRLETIQDVHDLGEDVLASDVVTFVEWGDTVRAALPDDRLEIDITHTEGDGRALGLELVGVGWQARRPALAEALAAWKAPVNAPRRPAAPVPPSGPAGQVPTTRNH